MIELKRNWKSEDFDTVFGGLFTFALARVLPAWTPHKDSINSCKAFVSRNRLPFLYSIIHHPCIRNHLCQICPAIKAWSGRAWIQWTTIFILMPMVIERKSRSQTRGFSPSHYLEKIQGPVPELCQSCRAPETDARLTHVARNWERYAQAQNTASAYNHSNIERFCKFVKVDPYRSNNSLGFCSIQTLKRFLDGVWTQKMSEN